MGNYKYIPMRFTQKYIIGGNDLGHPDGLKKKRKDTMSVKSSL